MSTAVADRHEGLNWHPEITIHKFSPEQCAFADAQVERGLSWGRLKAFQTGRVLPARRLAVAREVRQRQGGTYQALLAEELFATGAPEDGSAGDCCNLLTTAGLTAITALLTGAGGSNGKYNIAPSGTGYPGVGVGNATTAATVGDTHLGGDGTSGNAWYQIMDATFPTASAGVMSGQCTFASSSANFAWNEWCWTSGTGTTATSGVGVYTLASFYGTSASYAMWNHKIPSGGLGTKASGAAWVFAMTITLS